MRKLTFGMNLSLDGYIAAPGDELGWSVPSDELFQWWSDRVGATGLAQYGRKLWETMSSHWPTADQQPGATPAQIEFARRWGTCRRWCSPRRPARSTGTPAWSPATLSPRSPGSRLGWRSHGRRRRHPRRGGHAGRADRRVRDRHPPGPGGRRHAVLHGPGQLCEPEPGVDPDVSRRRAPDQLRDQALNTRPRIGAGSGHPRISWPLGDPCAGPARLGGRLPALNIAARSVRGD